jgi:hypothetical protein
VSKVVKGLWDKGNYDTEITICHMVQPRRSRDTGRDDVLNKPISDCYFEYGGEGDQVLQESGHDTNPFYVGRWDVLGGDVYGRGPGMDALPNVKQLQHEQKRKAQAIDKMVNPPMVAPPSLKGKPTTTLPGGTTYVDSLTGGQGFAPAYLVQPRLGEMLADIQDVQRRINSNFYADLFAMLIQSDRKQITATEIVEKQSEKLVLLGPVLQRLNVEVFNRIIEDAFEIAMAAGMIPEAPQELQDEDIEITYISLLAQAQEAASAGALERGLGFAGNMSAVFPSIVDVIDEDEAVRQYFDTIGVSPSVTRDQNAVAEIRAARAEQQAQQQQMEQVQQGADTASTLAGIDTQNPNALTKIMQGGLGG